MAITGELPEKFIDAHDKFSDVSVAERASDGKILSVGMRFETDGEDNHFVRQSHINGEPVADTTLENNLMKGPPSFDA